VPTDYRERYVECDSCEDRVDLPVPEGAHYTVGRRVLVEQGWTYRPNPAERPLIMAPHTYIWACPDCPSVNKDQSRHKPRQ
jgi:hypothetical protein